MSASGTIMRLLGLRVEIDQPQRAARRLVHHVDQRAALDPGGRTPYRKPMAYMNDKVRRTAVTAAAVAAAAAAPATLALAVLLAFVSHLSAGLDGEDVPPDYGLMLLGVVAWAVLAAVGLLLASRSDLGGRRYLVIAAALHGAFAAIVTVLVVFPLMLF